ncbi:hypothetical protein [Aurantiacibacter rhizosphaerae]|uniref:Inovirus Gp2 family protein n=1 Tax=Aurantiacibacter rhizosphaerae TaxID=2691582 RepID=A0A844X9W3_9SPHN|nr:hypothetical protein [Aurantiacibacter rhizosphaerae]MWV26438.1 hypothetical protein [Aurantiacibacter rhizosphaerae]
MKVAAMHEQPACKPHGGAFETSPRSRLGEASSMRLPINNGRIRAFPEYGTAHAIINSHLVEAADSSKLSGRGGARNSATRESYALTEENVVNLTVATRHACKIGMPFTRMVTIHWEEAGVTLAQMAKATGHYIDLLSKAIARHGSDTAYIWVHEGGQTKGGHCHFLIHVPARIMPIVARLQRSWLRRITGRPYRKTVILSKPIGARLGLEIGNPELFAANLEVALGYLCKAAPQTILDTHRIDRTHEPGGLIIGKRCGTSQNISAKARRES